MGIGVFSGTLFYSFTLHTIQWNRMSLSPMPNSVSFTGRYLNLKMGPWLYLTLNYNAKSWRLNARNCILAELLRPKTEMY